MRTLGGVVICSFADYSLTTTTTTVHSDFRLILSLVWSLIITATAGYRRVITVECIRPVLEYDILVRVDGIVVVAFSELECGCRQLVDDASIKSLETANFGCLVAEFVRRV